MKIFDISYCQPVSIVPTLCKSGDGLIIRNGYMKKTDINFKAHFETAQQFTNNLGSYTFIMANDSVEAAQEADATVKRLNAYKANITMPIYLDMEHEKYMKKELREANTTILMIELAALQMAGYNIGIYSNLNFISSYINLNELEYMYPALSLWLADYRARPYVPEYPVDIWQYGIEKIGNVSVDVNQCYVDFASRHKHFM